MKSLLPLIHKNGVSYTQVLRNDGLINYTHRVASCVTYYEVFIKMVKHTQQLFYWHYPLIEVYTSIEDFSNTAWTFSANNKVLQHLLVINGHQ